MALAQRRWLWLSVEWLSGHTIRGAKERPSKIYAYACMGWGEGADRGAKRPNRNTRNNNSLHYGLRVHGLA